MDETDRYDWAEARLFALYERHFADFQEELCRLDPRSSAVSLASICPRKLEREEMHRYLRERVPNPEIRRCWLERLLLFASPQELSGLRNMLDSVVPSPRANAQPDGSTVVGDKPATLRPPHFLEAKRSEEGVESGGSQ